MLDEIEEKGVKALLVETDEHAASSETLTLRAEGDALRNILKILEARNVFRR